MASRPTWRRCGWMRDQNLIAGSAPLQWRSGGVAPDEEAQLELRAPSNKKAVRMARRILATLRRTAIHAGPTVLGIIVLDFLLLQLMPGDAADVIASESGVATAETMAALRERFGLDQTVFTPLVNFLSHLAQ